MYRISHECFNDELRYINKQEFPWVELREWTSSYCNNSNDKISLKLLSEQYKMYLCNKYKLKQESTSSEENDQLMEEIEDYLSTLPKRIRKIITMKILHPEYSTTNLAFKLGCHRDSIYEDFKIIRREYPSLMFFTCYYKKKNK